MRRFRERFANNALPSCSSRGTSRDGPTATVRISVETYRPVPLSEAPDGRFTQLVQAAKQRRLVLYLGAGISIAPPACGPTGRTVADTLRPIVARIVGTGEADLAGVPLEELAQRVADEAAAHLDELRERAATAFDFCGIAPNFGHNAAALLLREGLVQVISVNWDCGVEQAGLEAGVAIKGVADVAESIQLAHTLPLYKIHGCATRPQTLAITQDDVDRPQNWAVGRTQGALAGGVVVFVGLGTIGLYVQEPFAELVSAWASQAQTIVVVDPQLRETWRNALGEERALEAHFARTADVFLDELLRALVREALDNSEQLALSLAQRDAWATTMVAGFAALRAAFDRTSADGVLRWWRDGVAATQAGTPFITELPGQKCVMTVAHLAGADGGDVEVAGVRGRQTVASATQYFEIVCRPGDHVSHVQIVGRDRIEQRHDNGVYPSPKQVTVVVVDALGEFPSDTAHVDIAAGDEDGMDIAAGVESIPIRFVAAEDGVRGRLAA